MKACAALVKAVQLSVVLSKNKWCSSQTPKQDPDESKDSSGIILATRFGLERKTKLRVIDDGRRTPVFPRRSKHWACF